MSDMDGSFAREKNLAVQKEIFRSVRIDPSTLCCHCLSLSLCFPFRVLCDEILNPLTYLWGERCEISIRSFTHFRSAQITHLKHDRSARRVQPTHTDNVRTFRLDKRRNRKELSPHDHRKNLVTISKLGYNRNLK